MIAGIDPHAWWVPVLWISLGVAFVAFGIALIVHAVALLEASEEEPESESPAVNALFDHETDELFTDLTREEAMAIARSCARAYERSGGNDENALRLAHRMAQRCREARR